MTMRNLAIGLIASALLAGAAAAQVPPTPQGTPVVPGSPPPQPQQQEMDVQLQGVIASNQAATSALQLLLGQYERLKLSERAMGQQIASSNQKLRDAEARLSWFDSYFKGLQPQAAQK